MPERNQYWLELTDEEKIKSKEDNKDKVVEFIVSNI